MASLQGTSTTTLTATSGTSATYSLTTSGGAIQQWGGQPYIISPYYDPVNNFVNLIANTNGFAWVTGFCQFIGYQSYFTTQQFWFALSRYGLQTTSGPSNDQLVTPQYYQDPSNPNINWLRLRNDYNASWANATLNLTVLIYPSISSNNITSSVLQRYN
jgi:hypothetical protein